MAQIANIVLNDGQATPVAHTFSPVTVDANGVAKLVDRASGISIGFPTLTQSVRQPSKGSPNYKVLAKIVVPVLEVTSPSTSTGIQPQPTIAYTLMGTVEFVLPERSSAADRANLYAYIKNYLANTNLSSAVATYEPIY